MNIKDDSCACGTAPKIIFSCSGAADVGAISDQAARKLTRDGVGQMACLTGIGGRVPGIIKSAEAASKILVMDGCPLNCAKKCLEEAGITKFTHLQFKDLDLVKGKSDVNAENIEKAVKSASALLEGED